MKPAKKTCSTPPAHCIRESFTQKKSSICFSLRFLGEWNLLRTRHVYQISICAVEEVNSFGFIAFSFRSEMLISCHDIKTLSGLSFHLLPKKTQIKTIQNNDAFWITDSASTNKLPSLITQKSSKLAYVPVVHEPCQLPLGEDGIGELHFGLGHFPEDPSRKGFLHVGDVCP